MPAFEKPIVADPDTIETVPELRRELHRVNAGIQQYWLAIEQRDSVGRDFAGLINGVLMQHLRGDFRGVAAILDAQLEVSPRLREGLEDTNEWKESRQTNTWATAATAIRQPDALPPYNCEGADPWSMKTVPELRQALDTANRAGIKVVAEVKALTRVLEEMTADVSKIIFAHLKGDRDALCQTVAAFCEKRVVVKDDKQSVH